MAILIVLVSTVDHLRDYGEVEKMSGGSFNYLWFSEPQDLIYKQEDIEEMACELEKLGRPDIAKDTREIVNIIKSSMATTESLVKSLEKVWKAIEWWKSCDW